MRSAGSGSLKGTKFEELIRHNSYQQWFASCGMDAPPGGESREEFKKRVLEGFEKVQRQCEKENVTRAALVVHGGTIMALMEEYARPRGDFYDYQVRNGEGYELILADAAACDRRIPAGSCAGRSGVAYHPVRLMGRLIASLEPIIRRSLPGTPGALRIWGEGYWRRWWCCVVPGCRPCFFFFLYRVWFPLGLLVETFFCYQLLAARSLAGGKRPGLPGVEGGESTKARRAVSMIVGRDTQNLTEEGVAKAAVETVAENTSDGVVAPLFYMVLFGAAGGFFYKSVNTMDSMIGYRNERYQYFGTAAARLDDVVNYVPARLSALFMLVAAFLAGEAWKAGVENLPRETGGSHKSPNAAQTEAVMAGALEVELAGDAWYFGNTFIGNPPWGIGSAL